MNKSFNMISDIQNLPQVLQDILSVHTQFGKSGDFESVFDSEKSENST